MRDAGRVSAGVVSRYASFNGRSTVCSGLSASESVGIAEGDAVAERRRGTRPPAAATFFVYMPQPDFLGTYVPVVPGTGTSMRR
jgi:hypothetical protein